MPQMHLVSVLCIALLTGCASLPGSVTEQIEGRRVEYVMTKNKPDVVVFENGLGGTLHWWAKVYPEISRNSTAFAYNRAGYGESATALTPRDGVHIVDELRATLRSKDLKPPYILVGHSLGGLYMQLFARRYPEEVKALILVDSTHPDQLKGNGALEKWPFLLRLALNITLSETSKAELAALDRTGEQLLSLPSYTSGPVFILSALKPMSETSELATDGNEKRKDLLRLYPGAKQIWVDSGHSIPLDKPDAVISAIEEVLARSGSGLHEEKTEIRR